jgi:DeoR/GlpR family transcriptional regulator of sugar metabolism
MIASERERSILEYLKKHGVATTETLAAVAGASLATIRRDLNSLGKKGVIDKRHGGAKMVEHPLACSGYPALSDDDPDLEDKERIAALSAGLVKSGDTIFLGAGKTCTLLARAIRGIENVKIVTTNINAVVELSTSGKTSMLLLGGDIHVGKNYIETLDEYTLRLLDAYYFDKVFITVNGADLEYGYSINFRLQVMLYEYLLQNSKEFHMMLNKGKFGKRAFIRFCAMDRIRSIVTTPDADPDYLRYFEQNGIGVHI